MACRQAGYPARDYTEDTMSNRDKIIDKIKKCLALSASSNEHEAAAALRQANKLMEQHGITDLDVMAAEACESRAKSGAATTPSNWESSLAGHVARGFSVRVIFAAGWKTGEWIFIGTGAGPEVAQYAFSVLLRQAKKARKAHIDDRLRRCRPGIRTRRADLFCEGWVRSVTALINNFCGVEPNPDAVDAYMNSKFPVLADLHARDRNANRNLSHHDHMDLMHGAMAGQDARLNKGVGGGDERKALT